METIDFTPLYRTTIGFDRLASVLDHAFRSESPASNYPPYDIQAVDDNQYTTSLAVAGFSQDELDIQVERGLLTVKGKKSDTKEKRNYLYQGIANRAFERKFNLADHVEITRAKDDGNADELEANMKNGVLTVKIPRKEVPKSHIKKIELEN